MGWSGFDYGSTQPWLTTGSSIAVVSRQTKTMELWYIGTDGSIQDAYYYDGAGWATFELAPAGSASTSGGITAVSRAPNTMEVWWIGPDASVQGAYWYENGNGWNRYQLAPAGSATTSSQLHAHSRNASNMAVFFIGPDQSVESYIFDAYASPGWNQTQIAGPSSAASTTILTGVSRTSSSKEIWWVSSSGWLQGAKSFGTVGPWQTYTLAYDAAIGGGLCAKVRDSNTVHVWWITSEDAVETAFWPDDVQLWQPSQVAPAGSASTQGGIAALCRMPYTAEIWWIRANGEVKDVYWYKTYPSWNVFDLEPANTASQSSKFAAVSRMPTTMETWYTKSQLLPIFHGPGASSETSKSSIISPGFGFRFVATLSDNYWYEDTVAAPSGGPSSNNNYFLDAEGDRHIHRAAQR